MINLGAIATAAAIAVGMCSLSTDASAARGGGHFGGGGAHFGGGAAHFGGGAAHFGGGVPHFGGPARFGGAGIAGNVGRWDGYRRYGFPGYGSYGWGGGWVDYPAYTSCYVWTPAGYVNQCGYDYSYYW